jgi:CBS-domain-containing membrane protein
MKILIRQVMTYGVETISPAVTIEEAAKKMRTHNIGMLPVLDGETLAGIVTDRDLVIRAVAERLRPETYGKEFGSQASGG